MMTLKNHGMLLVVLTLGIACDRPERTSPASISQDPVEEKRVSVKGSAAGGPVAQVGEARESGSGEAKLGPTTPDQVSGPLMLTQNQPQPQNGPGIAAGSSKPLPPAKWTRLRGRVSQSKRWGSGWLDLNSPKDFTGISELRVKVGGTAECLVVRLLEQGVSPDLDEGIIGVLDVPKNRVLELPVESHLQNVVQVSVHGGYPWAKYCSPQNGPATMITADVR